MEERYKFVVGRGPVKIEDPEELQAILDAEAAIALDPDTHAVTSAEENRDLLLANIRSIRIELLNNSDWTQYADSPLTDEVKAEWSTYRQALRDITNEIGGLDLLNPNWPTDPNGYSYSQEIFESEELTERTITGSAESIEVGTLFTISLSNYPSNQKINYKITGLEQNNLDIDLENSIEIDSNGDASIEFTVSNSYNSPYDQSDPENFVLIDGEFSLNLSQSFLNDNFVVPILAHEAVVTEVE